MTRCKSVNNESDSIDDSESNDSFVETNVSSAGRVVSEKHVSCANDLLKHTHSNYRGKHDIHRDCKKPLIARRAKGHFSLTYSHTILKESYHAHDDDLYVENSKYGVFHENDIERNSPATVPEFSPDTQVSSLQEVLEESIDTENVDLSDNSHEKRFTLRNLSRKEKYIVLLNCLTYFLCHISVSLLAPFFPSEIESRNISHSISGWIFGVYPLTQIVVSPIIGFIQPKVGCAFLILGGGLLVGGCTLLFGFLSTCPTDDGNLSFLTLAFGLRIFSGIGTTAQITASFTLCVTYFSDNISTIFGIGEIFVGVGMMLGPVIGGFLFQAGGFFLPFGVVGGLILINIPLNIFMLRSVSETGFGIEKPPSPPRRLSSSSSSSNTVKSQKSSLDEGTTVRKFVFHPLSLVNSLAITSLGVIWALLDPILAPHLSQFDLDADEIGLVFLLMAGCYSISCPVFGVLADKLPDKRFLLIPGFALATIGLLVIGPSPFIGLEPDDDELWMNLVAIVVLGISCSMAIVPTFDIYLQVAEKLGIEENVVTFSVLSGIYDSFYAVGDFLGPALGGWLTSCCGFNWCVSVGAAICFATSLIISISWCCDNLSFKDSDSSICNRCQNDDNTPDEKTPLLISQVETPHMQDLLQNFKYESV